MDPDTVRITSNENPLGPCKEGLEAIYKVAPLGGRYSPTGEAMDFVKMIAEHWCKFVQPVGIQLLEHFANRQV